LTTGCYLTIVILSEKYSEKGENRAMAFSKKQKQIVKQVADGTKSDVGYALIERSDDLKTLVEAKQVIVNEAITDGTRVAVRLVESGASTVVPNGVAAPMAYHESGIVKGIVPAEPLRGGKKEEVYPFSKMDVGDSFLVAVTAEYPKPWETFASTVSSATRRFSVEGTKTRVNRKGETVKVLEATKRFTLRRVNEGDKYPNGYIEPASGARVFRIA
jgi:hypothetical protein